LKAKAIVIWIILAFGVAVVVFNAVKGDRAPRAPLVAEGFKAPDVEVRDFSGNSWRFSAHRGDVVFINFWASWCKECREEMPSIQSLYDRMKPNPGFEMVLIIYNEDPRDAAKFMEENNYTMPLYVDPGGAAARSFGLTGVPETYIVSKEGILKKKVIGPADFSDPKAAEFIVRLIEGEEGA
jgi:cytochrome c biogenesis protein CcmG/thiol:disulfide interchange protein DsbE